MKHASVLIAVVTLVCASCAQTFRGGVEGTVTDSTGAAIPQAQVTVTNTGTGLARSSVTDDQGNYAVTELPLGTYSVTAVKTGFRKVTVSGIKVEVSARERVNVTLPPGPVQETVQVTSEVPLVETTIDNIGGTIEGETAAQLPVNGRDFTKLLVLVPGAAGDPGAGGDSPASFGLFSVNGNRGRSNNYLLDGTDMNDGYRNLPDINEGGVFGTPSTLLPIDAIAEVPVIANGEAEYGRSSGAIVNLVTKSGTNQLHGSGFEYFRNNALDARNFFNTAPAPQNTFHNNQFGGSLGGPIIKDKTFFFVAYEGQRESGGVTFAGTVPTQLDIAPANCGGTPAAGVSPIVANIICTVQPWGPIAKLPATGTGGAPVLQAVHFSNRLDSLIGKIDQHIGKDLLTGRYFFGDSDQSFPLGLTGGAVAAGYNTVTPTRVQVLSLSYTHVHSPKLLFEVRGGWNRFVESFTPEDFPLNPGTLVGLNTQAPAQDLGLPVIAISGFTQVGANNSTPRGRIDTNWQLFGNASYNTGRHNLKWGYEFRRTFINQFFDANHRGKLKFADFSDFLAGTPSGGSDTIGDSRRRTFENNHAFYFQDNFRLSRRVTINYGVRWDYYGVIGEKNNQFSIFDTSVAGGALKQVGSPGLSELYPKDLNNFAPRVSVAWDMLGTGKTVLRAGWGLYYDAYSQDFFVGQLPFNTSNPGPAYNGVPPNPILFFGGTPNLTPIAAVTCTAPNIAIPNAPGMCAPPAFDPTAFGATDVFTVAQNLSTPYVQNYNVNLQHAIGSGLSLQVGYVGSAGRHLYRYRDINQGTTDPVTGVFTRPFPAFTFVNQFESTASSTYHSLQVSLMARSFHGLTWQANYVWSHSIDNASDGQDFVPNGTQPDNSFNPAAERANSSFDIRHRFTWLWTYELPKFKTASWLTAGWAIDGVVTLATGQPVNLSFFECSNGTGECFERPDLVTDLVPSPFTGTSLPFNYLNLQAFKVPCNWDSVAGACSATNGGQHFGNLGRNAFVGPPFRNFDLSLVKNTPLGERVTMQLRADLFNILNHPNFANPMVPSAAGAADFNGVEATGHGIGFLPITTTPDVGLGNPFLGGGGPRNIQLAVRFSF